MTAETAITLTVNGREVSRTAGAHLTLLRWLRDVAGVTDPKYGCGEGICGSCTVLVDGQPVSSCLVLAAQVDGATVSQISDRLGPIHGIRPISDTSASAGYRAHLCRVLVARALAEAGRRSEEAA